MTNDFGAVVGPLILGALHDLTGGYTAPFILAFVIVVISTIVTSTMPNSKKLVS
jgi:cyanate permease